MYDMCIRSPALRDQVAACQKQNHKPDFMKMEPGKNKASLPDGRSHKACKYKQYPCKPQDCDIIISFYFRLSDFSL